MYNIWGYFDPICPDNPHNAMLKCFYYWKWLSIVMNTFFCYIKTLDPESSLVKISESEAFTPIWVWLISQSVINKRGFSQSQSFECASGFRLFVINHAHECGLFWGSLWITLKWNWLIRGDFPNHTHLSVLQDLQCN